MQPKYTVDNYACISEVDQLTLLTFQNIVASTLGSRSATDIKCLSSGSCFDHKTSLLTISDTTKVIGGAVYRQYLLNYHQNTSLRAFSVGPFVVLHEYQNQGLGKMLLEHLTRRCFIDLWADAIYLRGIPGYFYKQGFQRMTTRGRYIVKRLSIQKSLPTSARVTLKDLAEEHLLSVAQIYSTQTANITLSARRSYDDWRWLLLMRESSFFFEPKVILYDNNVVGYYTTDKNDPSLIRELLLSSSVVDCEANIFADIISRPPFCECEQVTIFSPSLVHINQLLSAVNSCEYRLTIPNYSGQLWYLNEQSPAFKELTHNEASFPNVNDFETLKAIRVSDGTEYVLDPLDLIKKSDRHPKGSAQSFIYQADNL